MNYFINFLKNKEKISQITNSNLFLAIITLLLFLSWSSGLAFISVITIITSIIFTTIYNDNSNFLGAILILTMISFPYLPYFDSIPWYLVLELCFFFMSFIVIIIKNQKKQNIKFSLGSIGFSLIVLGIVSLLCEIVRHITSLNPSTEYTLYGFMGVFFVLLIIGAFFLFHITGINNKQGYFQKVFYFINLLLIAEVIFIFFTNGFTKIDFNMLKWGEKNAFALMLEICLPFIALLYSKNIKRFDYILLIILDYFFIIISCSRGASITALLLVPLLIYICLNKRKDILKLYPFYLIFAYSIISLCYLFVPTISESVSNMLNLGLSLSYRDIIWGKALIPFNNNPIFGGGISALFDLNASINTNGPYNAIFFPHNTLITLLSSCGILGILSFGILLYEISLVFLNYKSKERYVYLFFVLVGIIHGIIDNTFYSIVYMFPLIYIFSNTELKGMEINTPHISKNKPQNQDIK